MTEPVWNFKVEKVCPFDFNSKKLNVIESFSWTATVKENNKIANVGGIISFDLTKIESESFITIEEIDNTILRQWVESSYRPGRLDEVLNNLIYQLSIQSDDYQQT
jgi:hypothetical protein